MFQNSTDANNGVLGGGAGNSNGTSMDPTQQQSQQNVNYNGMPPQQQQQQQLQQQQSNNTNKNVRKKPFVKITEQPAGKALRFRYECEGRSAGSIPGANSTPENKTYPSIEIVGIKGRAVVVVSCVTKDTPYRPHPHNLVGKEGCKKGVCTLEINSETMRAVFSNLGIQCVKKKDIESALKAREDIRVDPFKTGFSHKLQPSSIDLNAVRLCFQVFIESEKGRFTDPLRPVVSEPIFDKKAMSDLVICRLCSCSASVLGNTQIILLCEKVAKEDIAVRFYEEHNEQVVWEAYGEFQHSDVHKQTAITFKTPRYRTLDITEPAKVFIQLKRPSDGITSESLPFEYQPLDSDPAHLRRKRRKTGGDPTHFLLQQQQNPQLQNDHQDGQQGNNMNCWNAANVPAIKTEPRDTSPQPFGVYRAPPEHSPSPQLLHSPPSHNYNNNNTPPYNNNMANPGGGSVPGGNVQLLSPGHHQYNGGGAGEGGTSVAGGTPSVTPMSWYAQQQHQQHQQQQQQQQQHHAAAAHAHQQQFQGNHLFGSAGASQWEGKYNPAAVSAHTNNTNNNNMNNLTHSMPFNMQNVLTTNADVSAGGTPHSQWNLAPHMHNPHQQQHHIQQQQQHHQLQQQLQQQQQQYQHQASANNTAAGDGSSAVPADNSEQAPTVSNLLNFDSGQLVHINSEDQKKMLGLNSDDFQLSNLSISS